MKYILKSGRFYFTGFDGVWPTWMTNIKEAKRYDSKKEADDENERIFKSLGYKCEIIETL